jgi:lipopolysaccharide/colanic/teichoic acid biosynthesis glycosyltransferase/glycosyltransferase involved in cell wall biosynthesis
MSAMRILYATQWFEPEPVLKGIGFARLMRERGHDVRVVTGFPNYPGGRLYPGYRLSLCRREVMDGIPVDRVLLYPSHSRSAIGRAVNYLSFAASMTIYGPFTRRPDVLYAYHPPLTVGLAAAAIAAVRRIPLVYDIQDLWPDTLAATGMLTNRRMLALVGWLCRLVYARPGRIIVQSKGFTRALTDRGVLPAKIEVIANWANEDGLRPTGSATEYAAEFAGRFNVVYAGTMGPAQGLDPVLDAAERVAAEEPKVQFVFVGGGIEVERLKARAAEVGATSVRFLPPLPQTEIAGLLALADVLLVHLKNAPLFRITIPSKTQFYLALGKPILAGLAGDAADLITSAGAGIVVPPGDADALADAALRLARLPAQALAAMGAAGRIFYERELCARIGVDRTVAIIATAVAARRNERPGKRIFDLTIALIALVITAPLLPLIAALVWCDVGSPILWRQERPGLGGRPFRIYKFRTMNDAQDADGALLPDAERLTPIGRWLRRLSLDELPQLWNVLRGDISIVGPRPLLMAYLDRYSPEQARRHEVKPGITGWAQINGRNAISWEEKLALDVWYVDNRSLALDLKILAVTVAKVFRREGIAAPGHQTMPEFLGSGADERGGEQKPA